MRCVRFLPICFFAGVDGFTFFAPYLALLLVSVALVRMYRAPEPMPAPMPAPMPVPMPAPVR